MISLNPQEAEKKLSVFRRYFEPIMIIVLSFVTYHLYMKQGELESDMRQYLRDDNSILMEKVQASTSAVENATRAIEANTEVIKLNSELIRELSQKKQR